MTENRLPDYLDHIKQAATDACSFVEGMDKIDFINDKRTQQAVIMNLIIIGEAATKVMDIYPEFAEDHSEIPWRFAIEHAAHHSGQAGVDADGIAGDYFQHATDIGR